MKQYIALFRYVAASIKAVCTKNEIKYVTNWIITDFRRNGVLERPIEDFQVSPTPVQLPKFNDQHHGVIKLRNGISIYYGLAFT